ncbi:MAG: A/G-specific adenine glycosylase [Alphaproteobacteria bacterium]|nr:A/G-specific adenine glycosylase [Alphaproteobacteria bacterium]
MKRSLSVPKVKVKRTDKPAQRLLEWYDQHQRILPWRALPGTVADPYHVWLSEIMLQQTTVAAVGPYYQKFLKRWPTLQHLAKARLNDVMQMWVGLGYYRRARSLHECARVICKKYGGQFPETEVELLKLPGFGPYTAAAVASIAFNRRANVVDGNVERVVARIFAIRQALPQAKAAIRAAAATLLPDERPGDYAQALMDLGATICTPRNPKCGLCPWMQNCQAYVLGIADKLPRRMKAKPKPIRRAVAFVLTNKKGEVFLRRRPKKGLLGGMMEVPSSAWRERPMPTLARARKEAPAALHWKLLPGHVKHVFSHFELQIAVAVGRTAKPVKGQWVSPTCLGKTALPSVMQKIVCHALGLV